MKPLGCRIDRNQSFVQANVSLLVKKCFCRFLGLVKGEEVRARTLVLKMFSFEARIVLCFFPFLARIRN